MCTPQQDMALQLFRDYGYQPNDQRYQHFRQGNMTAGGEQIVALLRGFVSGPIVHSPAESIVHSPAESILSPKYPRMQAKSRQSDEQQVPALSPSDFGIPEINSTGKYSPIHRISVGNRGKHTDEVENLDEEGFFFFTINKMSGCKIEEDLHWKQHKKAKKRNKRNPNAEIY